MQDKFAEEISNGVVQLAQQGIGWNKLLAEAKEIYEKHRQAIKQEVIV
ncbi:hypothetical protein [Crassaminicella thermophila]|nr:hypothetical protein [Crassaminicella thermophila]